MSTSPKPTPAVFSEDDFLLTRESINECRGEIAELRDVLSDLADTMNRILSTLVETLISYKLANGQIPESGRMREALESELMSICKYHHPSR